MMTDQELENRIQTAFSHAAPDVLNSVLSDCQEQKGKVIVMSTTNRAANWQKTLIGIAAALILLIGTIGGSLLYQANYQVSSIVSLEVNPSVEIQVNRREEVLQVTALNADGEIVIGNMNFKGSQLDVAVNALIGSMLRNGYLNEIANSILVSVNSDDRDGGASLQQKLTEEINALLQTDTFQGAVLSQTVTADTSLQQLADSYGITPGKAQLIQEIISKNTAHTFDELVPLSINELNLISASGTAPLEQVNSVGTASDKAYIGNEKALEAALAHAGISADAIQGYSFELDYERGTIVYEIEFYFDSYEYNYDINALDGSVVSHDKEWDDDYHWPSGGHHSSSTPVQDTPSASGQESQPAASQETPVASGHHTEHHTGHHSTPATGGTGGNSSSDFISADTAKAAALSHAGVSADAVYDYDCELDNERGVFVYEIDFSSGGYEYEYEINATTGEVLKSHKERD